MTSYHEPDWYETLIKSYKGNMLYAYEKNRNDIVLSIDLCYGAIRGEMSCVHCKKRVFFVSSNSQRMPHFRHRKNESCIIDADEVEIFRSATKEAHAHILNRKSDFHRRWQDCFDPAVEVRKIDTDKRTFIADVFIRGEEEQCIQIWDDKNDAPPVRELVIEFQHSHLDAEQIKRRQDFYRSYEDPHNVRELLWVVDIEPYIHHLEKIIDIDGEAKYYVSFPQSQHPVLTHLLSMRQSYMPFILLDPGPHSDTLYKVARKPVFIVEKLCVTPVSRSAFLDRMERIVPLRHKWTESMQPPVIEYDQDYSVLKKDIEGNLEDVRKFITVIEGITYNIMNTQFRTLSKSDLMKMLARSGTDIECVAHLVCAWMSILFRSDARMIDMIYKWYDYRVRHPIQGVLEKLDITHTFLSKDTLKRYLLIRYKPQCREYIMSLLNIWYDTYTESVQDANGNVYNTEENMEALRVKFDQVYKEAVIQEKQIADEEERLAREADIAEKHEKACECVTIHEEKYRSYLSDHDIIDAKDDKSIFIMALLELVNEAPEDVLFDFTHDKKGCLATFVAELLGMIKPRCKMLLQLFWGIILPKRDAFIRDNPISAKGEYKGRLVTDNEVPRAFLWKNREMFHVSLLPLTHKQKALYNTISLVFELDRVDFYEHYIGHQRCLTPEYSARYFTDMIHTLFLEHLCRPSNTFIFHRIEAYETEYDLSSEDIDL